MDDSVRFATCNYCHAKLEIVHDSTVTHTRLMEKIERNTDQMVGNLRVIELQNDLERLDREWDIRRESFMVRGKNGNRYIPGVASSAAVGVVAAIFGMVVLSRVGSGPGGGMFTIFGMIFIVVAIFSSITGVTKANAHREAESAYESERDDLIAKIDDARRD